MHFNKIYFGIKNVYFMCYACSPPIKFLWLYIIIARYIVMSTIIVDSLFVMICSYCVKTETRFSRTYLYTKRCSEQEVLKRKIHNIVVEF